MIKAAVGVSGCSLAPCINKIFTSPKLLISSGGFLIFGHRTFGQKALKAAINILVVCVSVLASALAAQPSTAPTAINDPA